MCYYVEVYFCPGGCTCCVEVEPRLQTDLCWVPGNERPEHCWNLTPTVTRFRPRGPECDACRERRWAREEAEIVEFANSVGWVTKSGKK